MHRRAWGPGNKETRGYAIESEAILKTYIDFNTQKRAKATNEFEKAFV